MYERFTDRARKVMQLANQEAQRLSHEHIGTEHVLLALVKEGSGIASAVLERLGVDLRKIRVESALIHPAGGDMVTMGKLPSTPCTKQAIEYAIKKQQSLNHSWLGTEHLLLGLIFDSGFHAGRVLVSLGLNLVDIRRELLELLGADEMTNEWMAIPDGEGWWERRQFSGIVPCLVRRIGDRYEYATRTTGIHWDLCSLKSVQFRRPLTATQEVITAGEAVESVRVELIRRHLKSPSDAPHTLRMDVNGLCEFRTNNECKTERFASLAELHEKLTAPKQLVWESGKQYVTECSNWSAGAYHAEPCLRRDAIVWDARHTPAGTIGTQTLPGSPHPTSDAAKAACQEHFNKENA